MENILGGAKKSSSESVCMLEVKTSTRRPVGVITIRAIQVFKELNGYDARLKAMRLAISVACRRRSWTLELKVERFQQWEHPLFAFGVQLGDPC